MSPPPRRILAAGPHGRADGPAPCVRHRAGRPDHGRRRRGRLPGPVVPSLEQPLAAPAGAVVVSTDAPLDERPPTPSPSPTRRPARPSPGLWMPRASAGSTHRGQLPPGVHRRGSLPAYCHDVLSLYCEASRTARNYDDQGRWLGWDLVPVQSKEAEPVFFKNRLDKPQKCDTMIR